MKIIIIKNTTVFFIFISILFGSIAYSIENQERSTLSLEEKNPNHFYFGPEFLCSELNIHVNDIKVYGVRFFWGFRLGYEYLKPKAFYAGADILGTSTRTDFKASQEGRPV